MHNTVQTSSRVSPGSSLAAALLGVLGHPVVHPITWQPSYVLAVEVFPAQFGVLKCSRALPSGRDDSGVIAVGSVDPLALKLPVYLRHRLQPRRLVRFVLGIPVGTIASAFGASKSRLRRYVWPRITSCSGFLAYLPLPPGQDVFTDPVTHVRACMPSTHHRRLLHFEVICCGR